MSTTAPTSSAWPGTTRRLASHGRQADAISCSRLAIARTHRSPRSATASDGGRYCSGVRHVGSVDLLLRPADQTLAPGDRIARIGSRRSLVLVLDAILLTDQRAQLIGFLL